MPDSHQSMWPDLGSHKMHVHRKKTNFFTVTLHKQKKKGVCFEMKYHRHFKQLPPCVLQSNKMYCTKLYGASGVSAYLINGLFCYVQCSTPKGRLRTMCRPCVTAAGFALSLHSQKIACVSCREKFKTTTLMN